MRHDAVLWIQWQAEILAVVFLFHWRTLNLLSEAIRLETFIECSLDFGCIGIEVFVDDVIHITCNGNLSLAYDTDKFSHTLMNVLADANMSAISCGKTCICHELTDILLSTLFLHSVDWLKFTHIIILICCIFIKTLLLVGNS